VNVDLREKMSHEIVRAVTEGMTDIGIVSGIVRTEGLEAIPYRKDHLVLAVPAAHPLAKHTAISFAETLDHDHVSLHEASAIHSFVHARARDVHRSLKLRIQVGNFEAACRLIEAGAGIGVLPQSAATRQARQLAIRIVPLSDDWSLRHLHICVRSMALLPQFAADLVSLLVADGASEEGGPRSLAHAA